MTKSDGHDDLPKHATLLTERLATLPARFIAGRIGHDQHMQHADRCRVLSDHLTAVHSLAGDGHYAGALSITRTALEHHLLDRLLFLANRWIAKEKGISRKQVRTEEKRLAALQAGPRPDIARWSYDPATGTMNVIIRGLFAKGSVGRGATLSPYYFRAGQYNPFTIDGRLTRKVAAGFLDPGVTVTARERAISAWYAYFTYERLRENLDLNRLLQPRLGVQVDVHHAFLSAFVHGTQKAYELAYGRNLPRAVGEYDHYSSELCLLYVIVIAAAELEIFGRMAKRTPRLRLRDWSSVVVELDAARRATNHFWFLSGEPTLYDRIQESDTRMRWRPTSTSHGRTRVDPASLDPRRVRYYANPLERLIRLHLSYRELTTGQVYRSPFPRRDAAAR